MAGTDAGRGLIPVAFLLLSLGVLIGGQKKEPQNSKAPLWWELKVELKTEGEYRTREEKTAFSGDYQLTVLWTGTMERDAGDYRLFHSRSETTRWKAQETADSPASLKILTSDEFRDVPQFNMQYVLRKDDRLHFAFLVEGFYAPRAASAEKRFIPLPVTRECPEILPEPDYGSFIVRGSNSVSIEESEIYKKAVDKEFAWTWKHQEWMPREKEPSLFSARHRADVRISVTPHYEKQDVNHKT
jgi:hypothetical protein